MRKGLAAGVSLIELVITLGLGVLLLGVGISSYVEFSKREALDAGAAAIAGGLRDARAQTLASVGGSQYGLRIEDGGFVLFKGSSYVPGAAGNEIFYWSSHLKASSTPGIFVFYRITGNAVASGTIDLYIASDPEKKRTITIGSTGLVNVQ
jgi:hypothetical protein